MSTNQKIESLQALRGIACFGVLVSHSVGIIPGTWGVSIFFVLSGFVMVYSYYNRINLPKSLKESVVFGYRKLSALFPLHFIMTLAAMGFALYGIYTGKSYTSSKDLLIQIVLNLTMLKMWVPIEKYCFSLNGVSWYLCSSLFHYIMFPLLLKVIKSLKNARNAKVMIMLVFGCQLLLIALLSGISVNQGIGEPLLNGFSYERSISFLLYYSPIFRLGDYFAGCCLGYIYINRDAKKEKDYTFFEIILLIVVVFSMFMANFEVGVLGSMWIKDTVLFLPSTLLVVYLFAICKGAVTKKLNNKVLLWGGSISPYVFLIHQQVILYVQALYRMVFGKEINKIILLFLTLFITLAITFFYKNVILLGIKYLKEHFVRG